MEDTYIIELFWSRSEQAIYETAKKYGNYCHAIAYGILSNAEDADECVNDTYLHAWNNIPPTRPNFLSAFLGKITRRVAINKWKSTNAQKRGGGEYALALDELGECIPSTHCIEQELDAKELACKLDVFLSKLPEIQRKIFVRRYWYFNSISELSSLFGFTQSKVKSMLYHTRKKLLLYLQEEGFSL